jgi:hypothetical protein
MQALQKRAARGLLSTSSALKNRQGGNLPKLLEGNAHALAGEEPAKARAEQAADWSEADAGQRGSRMKCDDIEAIYKAYPRHVVK